MRIKKYEHIKWFKITHSRFTVDFSITPCLGLCSIHFPYLADQNKIYFGEIGYKRLKDIAEVFNKIANLAEKMEKENNN